MTPERKERIMKVLEKRQDDLTVVLENVSDPHNISAVMRTCDAVGIQDIFVLNTTIPLHKKWGRKSSSSAKKWLTIHQFSNSKECFDLLRKNKYSILASQSVGHHKNLYEIDFTQPLALVFGNEHTGVSEDILALTDGRFTIPQVGMIRSLNISVACAVTIYEAYRQKSAAGHYNQSNLPESQLTLLLEKWDLNSDPDV